MAGEQIEQIVARYRGIVEEATRRALPEAEQEGLHRMLRYHLGLAPAPDGSPPGSGGKRLRGVLCLLSCESVGGDAVRAAPAAAALELLHGFTLLHDDVADQDETRRGRPTVWRLWGTGQAITAGDSMYALANLAAGALAAQGVPSATVLRVLLVLNRATLAVCDGQHLDLAFEGRPGTTVPEYLHMIGLKTAALFSAATEIGAEVGGGEAGRVAALRQFGREVGMAFQIQDDSLGLWGEAHALGKPVGSDLRRNKRSLPILYALNVDHPVRARLAARLAAGVESDEEAASLAGEMAAAGVRSFCEEMAQEHLDRALEALGTVGTGEGPRETLAALARDTMGRRD
jgi:geranylgeranyl diphosphate synthase, type I